MVKDIIGLRVPAVHSFPTANLVSLAHLSAAEQRLIIRLFFRPEYTNALKERSEAGNQDYKSKRYIKEVLVPPPSTVDKGSYPAEWLDALASLWRSLNDAQREELVTRAAPFASDKMDVLVGTALASEETEQREEEEEDEEDNTDSEYALRSRQQHVSWMGDGEGERRHADRSRRRLDGERREGKEEREDDVERLRDAAEVKAERDDEEDDVVEKLQPRPPARHVTQHATPRVHVSTSLSRPLMSLSSSAAASAPAPPSSSRHVKSGTSQPPPPRPVRLIIGRNLPKQESFLTSGSTAWSAVKAVDVRLIMRLYFEPDAESLAILNTIQSGERIDVARKRAVVKLEVPVWTNVSAKCYPTDWICALRDLWASLSNKQRQELIDRAASFAGTQQDEPECNRESRVAAEASSEGAGDSENDEETEEDGDDEEWHAGRARQPSGSRRQAEKQKKTDHDEEVGPHRSRPRGAPAYSAGVAVHLPLTAPVPSAPPSYPPVPPHGSSMSALPRADKRHRVGSSSPPPAAGGGILGHKRCVIAELRDHIAECQQVLALLQQLYSRVDEVESRQQLYGQVAEMEHKVTQLMSAHQ